MKSNEIVGPHASLSLSAQKQRKLKAAQIRRLYAQSGIGSLGVLLGAVILGGALWNVVSHDRIVVWVLAYAALVMGRHCLIHFFHKRERDEDQVIRWGTWHTLAVSTGRTTVGSGRCLAISGRFDSASVPVFDFRCGNRDGKYRFLLADEGLCAQSLAGIAPSFRPVHIRIRPISCDHWGRHTSICRCASDDGQTDAHRYMPIH